MSDALDVITCAIERSPWLSPRHIAEVVENDLVNALLIPDADAERAAGDRTTTEAIDLDRIEFLAKQAHQDWAHSDYFGCGTVSWYDGVAGGLGGEVGELCGEMTPAVALALVAELREARAAIARVKALRDRYVDSENAERKRATRAFLRSDRAKHQDSAQQCFWAHDSLTLALGNGA
jgi:hypothetical protein